jgi:hypothetical protein
MLQQLQPQPAPAAALASMLGSRAVYSLQGSACCRNSAYCNRGEAGQSGCGDFAESAVAADEHNGAPAAHGRASKRVLPCRVKQPPAICARTCVQTSWHLSYSSAISFRWVDCTA